MFPLNQHYLYVLVVYNFQDVKVYTIPKCLFMSCIVCKSKFIVGKLHITATYKSKSLYSFTAFITLRLLHYYCIRVNSITDIPTFGATSKFAHVCSCMDDFTTMIKLSPPAINTVMYTSGLTLGIIIANWTEFNIIARSLHL